MPVNIQLSKIEESFQLSAKQTFRRRGGEKPIADG
jgi:hypothetical protein